MNNSVRVENKILEIKNIEYSLKDYDSEREFKHFNYKHKDIKNDWFLNGNSKEILNNSQDYIQYLPENQAFIADYKNIMSLDRITDTTTKAVDSPVPAYQIFSFSHVLTGIEMLKDFENGNTSHAIELFETLHNQKHEHMLNSNTLISKLVFFNHLEKDLVLAKIVKEKYNIQLNVKKLSYNHVDIEKAVNSEIEMIVNLTPTLTSSVGVTKFGMTGHFKVNFMNEIGMRPYFKLIDYYKDKENKIKPQNDVFKPSLTEKMIAPVEIILLNVAMPDYFSYRDDFFNYNNLVDQYNSLN